jgi:4-amino-4-deoxychorismate lyase
MHISINGISAEHISVMDRGLHYGDGLFETIACVEGKLQFWDDHINRMNEGAKVLDIECPASPIFLNDINTLLSDKHGRHVVKILLTRGQMGGMGGRGYKYPVSQQPSRIIIINEWPDYEEVRDGGVHLCFCKHTLSVNANLSGIKHLNRLDNVLARNEWKDEFHEGLMSDINGNIIEGTMSNVFGIKNGDLYTPSLDCCGVNGIIRKHIIDIAKNVNIPLHISNLSKDDLYSMDEIFITNSIIGLWPVSLINDKSIRLGNNTNIFYNELQKRLEANAKYIA